MLFSSLTFLYFFLPAVVAAYFIFRGRRSRNAVLLAASLLFYSWGEPKYLLLLLLSALAAYLCGLGMENSRAKPRLCRLYLVITISALLGCLIVFKYLNFLCANFSALTGISVGIKTIALPIGISFYTFQILSYIIDLYRGKVKVQRSFPRFLLYVSFFPQLIAGPIVRYETVENEIGIRHESWEDAALGLKRFILGLSKKVLIANNVALVAESIYGAQGGAGTGALWLAALCYSLQIYFDFSGYSDMAIGLGRIFGFHFLENFNYPYIASSITDFWRRWHISLSSWFRDYVYIPLGGSRVSRGRHIFNLLVVWGLTGLWHGAEWNFVLWGLYYAALLIAEKLVLGKYLEKLPGALRHLYVLFFVVIGWVIFYMTDFTRLLSVLKTMLGYQPTDWRFLLTLDSSISMKLLFILPAIVLSAPVLKGVYTVRGTALAECFSCFVYVALLALSIMFIISSSYNPFIYFRF